MQFKVISGFPGVGKSYAYNIMIKNRLSVSDSDSSLFRWLVSGNVTVHPEWPNNYIDYIKSLLPYKTFIFVSSHAKVRKALVNNDIFFSLVYRCSNLYQMIQA